MSRLVFAALTDWPYPPVATVSAPFRARWSDTRLLLMTEVDKLGANHAVVELDLEPRDIRQDGEIRANARLRSGRVRLTLASRHGPLQYACDRYDGGYGGPMGARYTLLPWHSNARAIALTLQSLRAVDRYGAVRAGEQYRGFAALPAAAARPFDTADEALRWLLLADGYDDAESVASPHVAYRAAVKRLHPDVGGDPAQWALLDEAWQLITAAGLDKAGAR